MLDILGKTKDFFAFLNKKKTLLSVFFLGLLGLLIPKVSYAGLAINIANSVFMTLFWLIARILAFFVGLAGDILNWVISPNFITFSYTNPYGLNANPIIAEGLKITQGLVNMILILVIVYIAIATILRLAGYETKKLLITFFIVALLINFAPVICGVVVDASNIVMNFFVKELSAEGFGNILVGKIEEISSGFKNDDWEDASKYTWQMAALIPLIGMLIIILVAFAVLFMLRYLVIWMLVILAPLAFAAYILPSTRKYFEQWWSQLINWSFVGATCGFFLYLSFLLLNRVPDAISTPVITGETMSVFNSILPYFVSVVFLGLGLVVGLKTSAMGASTIISSVKARGRKTAKLAGKWAGRGALGGAGIVATSLAGAARGAKEGQGIRGRISGIARGAATFEGREKGREGVGRILEKMHLVKPGTYEAHRRKRWKVEEETKKMEKLPTDRLHEIANRTVIRPADRAGALAAFEGLAKRGALRDNENHLVQKMKSFGADTSQVFKARPDWTLPKSGVTKSEAIKKQVASISTGDFTKNVQAAALRSTEVVTSLDAPKIDHIGLRGSAEQKTALRKAVTQNSATFNEIYNKITQLYTQNTQQSNQEGDRIMNILTEISSNLNLRP